MRRLTTLIGTISLAAVASYGVAQSGYAFRKTDIRAGYFHLSGDHLFTGAGTSLTAPHVWYNLEVNSALKPSGWSFTNPLAAGRIETDEVPFFLQRFADTPAAGFGTSKSDARYWWVNVAGLSDDDLALLDVGLLQVTTPNLTVAPSDRERLRRFVDKGGVLWIDLTYGTLSQSSGGPIPFFASSVASPDSNLRWDPQSPLLNYPNNLTSSEIQAVGYGPSYGVQPINKLNLQAPDLGFESASAISNLMGNLLGFTGEYGALKPVVAAGGLPTVAAGKIGDGYVVVTTRGVSELINRVGANTNRNYFAVAPQVQNGRANISAYAASAAKLVFNAISLANQSTQTGAGSRKNYSTFIDQGAPMIQTWQGSYGSTLTSTPRQNRPPVIYKGLSFVTTDNQIFCYDMDPRGDADGDGNFDDGFADTFTGDEEDRVFSTAPIGGGISSAVAVEVPNAATGVPTDQLLVTTGDGRLLVYSIFDANRRLQSSLTLAPVSTLTPGLGGTPALATGDLPKAPTVHEGIAYIADTVQNASNFVGRLWQVNLRTLQVVRTNASGANAFVFGGTALNIPRISSSPTVGYIPILDNSGALDKVAYLPLAPNPAPAAQNPGMMSVWIGSKGEKPSSVGSSSGVVEVVTRAATKSLPIYLGSAGDPLSPKISVIRNNGTALTAAEMATIFSGGISQSQGTLILSLNPTATWPPVGVDEDGIRVDYTIDWGQAFPGGIAGVERGRLLFPSPNGNPRSVVDGLALSPSGTLYATTSTQRVGPPFGAPITSSNNDHLGTLFAVREEGRGLFRLVYRWDLYPQHQMNYQGGSRTIPAVLPDNDPVQYLSFGALSVGTFIGGQFRASAFQGAPVIRNNEVYVTVSGQKSFSPASALLCFKDETASREIRIGRPVGSSSVIIQPDMARSSDPTNPTVLSSLGEGEYRIEREPGEVGAIIRVDNMMRNTSGLIADSISTSQPIILRSQGQPDQVIDPALSGDRWNPLKWYTIFHGTTLLSSAYASGNTVFVSGASYLPSILDFNFPPVQEGFLSAIRTDFDPNVAKRASQAWNTISTNFTPNEVVADDTRPYMKQLIAMDYPRASASWTSTQQSLSSIYPNSNYVWPQNPRNLQERGKTSLDDYRIRVNQCTLRGGTSSSARDVSYGIVGGDGALLAWNSTNVFGFRKADFWVADEGRISQFDPSGNVIYDSKLALSTGATGGNTNAARVSKFSRPTRVYPIPNSADILVVDSDQNRVIRMNPNGAIARELTEFALDSAFVPSGFRSGDPLTFANPRDAATYTSEVLQANNKFSNAQPLEQWRHYLVADQGNNRLIEVVDRYAMDITTGQLTSKLSEGTLLWHSMAQVSGKGYAYNSFSRVQVGANSFMIVAGVGGKSPTRMDAGEPNMNGNLVGDANPNGQRSSNTGNGGIVIFSTQLPGGYRVFDQYTSLAVDPTRKWDFNTGSWSMDPSMAGEIGAKNFQNLQSVTASLVPGGVLAVMVTDSTGVYEFGTSALSPTTLVTRWMLPSYAMSAMRRIGANGGSPTDDNPARFYPTYARRLDEDNVIVVNGYQGRNISNNRNFLGEVLQIDGRIDPVVGLQPVTYSAQGFSTNIINLGFNTRSIKLRFGPIEGARGLVLPVFADRR